jgi:hypothetical protein
MQLRTDSSPQQSGAQPGQSHGLAPEPRTAVGSPLITSSGVIRLSLWGSGAALLGLAIWGVSHEPGNHYNFWILVSGEVGFNQFVGLVIAKSSIVRVELDSKGVAFVYLFRRDVASWPDIEPGNRPAWKGVWVVRQILSRTPQLRIRRHYVTTHMGLAIVRSPYHSPWNVSEGVLSSIGFRTNAD